MRLLVTTIFGVFLSTAVFAGDTEERQKQFVRGAEKWGNNCMKCHNRRDAAEFSDAKWRAIMLHMRLRAGFTGQDTRDVLTFMQDSNN